MTAEIDSFVLCSGALRCNPGQTKEGGNFCRHSIPHAEVCRCSHSKPCPGAGETGMVRCHTQNRSIGTQRSA